MPNFISEDHIEQALLRRLQHLHGFDVLDCQTTDPEDRNDGSRRGSKRDVILVDRVKAAAVALNPGIPEAALDDALERFLDRRQAMTLVAAVAAFQYLRGVIGAII
jgi:type I restriction enzyme R subunit